MDSQFEPLRFDTHENSMMKGSFSLHNDSSSMQNIFNEISAGMTVSVKSPHEIYTGEPRREDTSSYSQQMPKQIAKV